jgi:hypothetical protein
MCIGLTDAKENIRIGITDANNFLVRKTPLEILLDLVISLFSQCKYARPTLI